MDIDDTKIRFKDLGFNFIIHSLGKHNRGAFNLWSFSTGGHEKGFFITKYNQPCCFAWLML